MRPKLLPALLALSLAAAAAAPAAEPPPPDATLVQRSARIVSTLGLDDSARAARVTDEIARQYEALRRVHDARDARLHAARQRPVTDKAAHEAELAAAHDQAAAQQAALHYAFLARLGTDLSPAQVEQVKDGMTYGVAPNTYRVYLEMLPNLSDEQRRQLLAWLHEAREHAMDAGSSEEKHAWFGKYKGRINNYLAAAGIDMKQAEREMLARRKPAAN